MTDRFPPDWDPLDNGYIGAQWMDDGRLWCLMPLIGGRFRIVIVEDQFTAGEHWCYGDRRAAIESWERGPDIPPTGWTRHMLPDGRFERFDQHGELYVDG